VRQVLSTDLVQYDDSGRSLHAHNSTTRCVGYSLSLSLSEQWTIKMAGKKKEEYPGSHRSNIFICFFYHECKRYYVSGGWVPAYLIRARLVFFTAVLWSVLMCSCCIGARKTNYGTVDSACKSRTGASCPVKSYILTL
jgi:hypothetical protein